jgi:hypothetical protein
MFSYDMWVPSLSRFVPVVRWPVLTPLVGTDLSALGWCNVQGGVYAGGKIPLETACTVKTCYELDQRSQSMNQAITSRPSTAELQFASTLPILATVPVVQELSISSTPYGGGICACKLRCTQAASGNTGAVASRKGDSCQAELPSL